MPFTPEEHHDALADATATARIAKIFLERARANGFDDLAGLLAAASGGRTTTVTASSGVSDPESDEPEALVVPDAHLARHGEVFPNYPTATDRRRFAALFAECAALRCLEIAGPDGISDHEKRRLLFGVLADAANRKDGTAVAVVLGALAPLLRALPDSLSALRVGIGASLPRVTGWKSERGVGVALWLYLDRLLAGVSRCLADRPCPACRLGQPCPRDTWADALAVFMLPEPTEKTAISFWNPRGQPTDERGKGGGRGWAAMWTIAPPLADATLRRCLDFYRSDSKLDIAEAVVDQVWRAGCRDPGVVAQHALITASSSRPADLEAAIVECREVVAHRRGNTDRAWDHLEVVLAMLNGRLARAQVPPTTRHVAQNPLRPARTPRFLRRAAG